MQPIEPKLPAPTAARDTCVRQDRFLAGLLFLGVFAVYGGTLCRTIYTGDDGDFITAMATFGTPHPTGYPLYCLLGRLFLEIVPFGNPALRVNLMTALFGAASVAVFFRFLALLVPQRFWAAAAALLLAFTPTLWQQSLSCEVYSLTCLFLSALLYLATLWLSRPDDVRLLRGLAFTYGLALTNHLSMALFLPGVLLLVFAGRRSLWREGKTLASLVALLLLPLALYAYLPLAARCGAPVNWGDPSTPAAFLGHVTGAMFRDEMFSSAGVMWEQARAYGGYLVNEFGLWLLWLVPVGAVALWRRQRGLCLLLLYIWAANVVYAISYDIFDIYVYYLPSYMAAAALLAAGAPAALGWAWDRLRLTAEARARYARLAALAALTAPVLQMSLHYAAIDKSGNFLEDDFSANILRSSPAGALVVTSSTVPFTLWYRRFVLGERPDLVPIHRAMARGLFGYNAWYCKHLPRMYPDVAGTGSATPDQAARGEFLLQMMRRAVARDIPVIVIADARYDDTRTADGHLSFNEQVAASFDRVPWGVGERLYSKGQAPPPGVIVAENERLWRSFVTRGLYTTWAKADPMQGHIPRRYAEASLSLGALAEEAGRYHVAKAAYERSLRLYHIPAAYAGLARCSSMIARWKRQW